MRVKIWLVPPRRQARVVAAHVFVFVLAACGDLMRAGCETTLAEPLLVVPTVDRSSIRRRLDPRIHLDRLDCCHTAPLREAQF